MVEINQNPSSILCSPKRVLFIITQSEMGGAQRFLVTLLPYIRNKYEIKVAYGSDGGSELPEKLKLLNIDAFKLLNLKRNISPAYDTRAILEIKNLIKSFKPDTLFLLSSKAGFIGSLAAKFISYRLPISTHSNTEPMSYLKNKRQMKNGKWKIRPRVVYRIGGWSFNDPGSGLKRKIWLMLEKLSAKWKDIIIVNNRHDLEQAKKLDIKPRGRTILIHNGIDVYKYDYLPKEEARLKLFEIASKRSGKIFPASEKQSSPSQIWRQSKIIIGTIANLYPTKGIENIISTAEYFKNDDSVVFIVIGDGTEYNNLKLRIANCELENKVLFLGNIPDAKKYLPAFDIFVLPSVKEGFPWVLLEAMTAKLPIIATNVGAIPEIIDDGRNGFMVEPSKPELIAEKIKEILTNDRLRQELGIQAHQTLLAKFSLDKMIEKTEEVISN